MTLRPNQVSALRVILTAGLLCAALDGVSTVGVLGLFGATPAQVFQGIASWFALPRSGMAAGRFRGHHHER